MKVVGRSRMQDFCGNHAGARSWVENWLADAERATWRTPQQIKERYPTASFLGENVVIFNVKGNDYRLEVTIAYKTEIVAVQWIGTHAEYDKRNKKR